MIILVAQKRENFKIFILKTPLTLVISRTNFLGVFCIILIMEIWKDVKGYEGTYKVSSLGRVKSLKFNKERVLKLAVSNVEYQVVTLCSNSNIKTFTVHQLVAVAFLNHKPCGMKKVIDHINDVKTDNRVENLQIVTQRFNNRKTQGSYSSQYKGVSWYKPLKKWLSHINLNGKTKHLGYFTSELEASQAYQTALLTV